MIEILERREQQKYKVRCNHCESLLSYTILDEQKQYSEFGFEGYCQNYYINCPVCQTHIIVASDTEQHSYNWRIRLDDEKQI